MSSKSTFVLRFFANGPQGISRKMHMISVNDVTRVMPGLPIDRLSVCRRCGGVYGNVTWNFQGILHPGPRQHCDCQPTTLTESWPNFDFPEAVTLCRCCGRRALASGSRWSLWFCRTCLPAIQTINRLCGTHVLPPSRGSLLEQIEGEVDDNLIVPTLPAAVLVPTLLGTETQDWFIRVERLEAHARSIVRKNVEKLSNRWAEHDVPFANYLCELPATRQVVRETIVALGRAFDVPADVLRDVARDIESQSFSYPTP